MSEQKTTSQINEILTEMRRDLDENKNDLSSFRESLDRLALAVGELASSNEQMMKSLQELNEKLDRALSGESQALESFSKDLDEGMVNPWGISDISKKPGDILRFGSYLGKKLDWRVLDVKDRIAFIITTESIDSRRFDAVKNNYASSEIRRWLNNEFYNTFTSLEKARIVETTVNNGVSSMGHTNRYACGNTEDYIFLLSSAEAKKYFKNDDDRICLGTEYAQSNGLYESDDGTSYWWLRSPDDQSAEDACIVDENGSLDYQNAVYNDNTGVRPACIIRL